MKLERARKFIGELRTVFDDYAKDSPLSARATFDEDGECPHLAISWKGIGLLPGAIIGDAVHNIRTALDLMASELARLNGESDRNVYFPFASSAANFPKQLKSKGFHKTGVESVIVLEGLRPYRGGDESLRAIHDLDIEDKHTALIPAHANIDFAIAATIEFCKPEGMLLPVSTKDVQFMFPSDKPLGGMPILETLERLVQLVECILNAFAVVVAARSR